MEAFNKTIIQKIKYIKLQTKNNFNINDAIKKAFDIYNNTVYSSTKVEPAKSIKMIKKK